MITNAPLSGEFSRMKLALELAESARGQTWPNPMVGALVIKDGAIVGMGAHLKAGTAHAEVHAIEMAGPQAKGSTVYVTLEPCSHYGRTPPCADLLIQSGVSRVVIAMPDPNPLVAGRGIRRLQEAGIEVSVGVLEQEARRLAEEYVTFITKKRPFTLVKTAMTLDGRMATSTGDSRWISTEQSRRWVHELRSEYQCIVVGRGTVSADDPLLTCRLPAGGRNPVRVVIDSSLQLPLSAKVFSTAEAPTWVACTEAAPEERREQLMKLGVDVLVLPEDEHQQVPLGELWHELARRGIATCLVEGGSTLIGSLLRHKLIDRWMTFINPKLVGGSGLTLIQGWEAAVMKDALRLEQVEVRMSGGDIVIMGDLPAQEEPACSQD
ncbi:MAG: ribD [Bacilli bacterium]|nr:ribD [Bacilli bacterium]